MALRTFRTPRASPHATTRSPRYVLGPGADLPIARIVAVLLVVIPLGALLIVNNLAKAGPSPEAQEIASFDPRSVLADQTPHFLPTPVAALPPDADAGPPPPAAGEDQQPAETAERVKIVNTGRAGAILRADPPRGAQVATLRDGTVVDVLEQQTIDDAEWLHVRTADGVEGWVFARLATPAD